MSQQVVNNSNSNNNNTSNVYNIIQIHIDRKEADDTIKGLVGTVHKQNNPNGQPETYTGEDSADQVFNI